MKTLRILFLLLMGCPVSAAYAQNVNASSTTPAAPSGGINCVWQHDSSSPVNLSCYIPSGTYDPAGTAASDLTTAESYATNAIATALTSAEAFSANANHISSGSVGAAYLPGAGVTTINGTPCTIGGSCSPAGASASVDTRPSVIQTTGKGPSLDGIVLPAGGSAHIFSVAPGTAGTITYLHLTIGSTASDSPNLIQNSVLEIACDGAVQSVPLGLFFLTYDAPVPFSTDQVSVPLMPSALSGDFTFNRKVFINFTNGCTITLVNASSTATANLFFDVTYKSGAYTGDATLSHWNAYVTSFPTLAPNTGVWDNPQVELLPSSTYANGGQLESVTEFVQSPTNYTYLEGSPTVTADGAMSVVANGGEDFFGCGYYCNHGLSSAHTNKWGILIGSTGLQDQSSAYDFLGYRFFTSSPGDNVYFSNTLSVATASGMTGFTSPGTVALSGLVTWFTATPTVSPVAASPAPSIVYATGQTVALSEPVSGSVICYTTDGSAPAATTPGTCSHGSAYSSPIALSTTAETIEALGTLSGYNNSPPVIAGPYATVTSVAYEGNCIYGTASGTSVHCSITTANTGETLVVFANATASVSSVIDSLGGTAALIETVPLSTNNVYAYYFSNVSVGTHTITVNLSATSAYPALEVMAVAGASTSSPIDVYGGQTETTASTSISTGSITTTGSNELVVGYVFQNGEGGTWTSGTPAFTEVQGEYTNNIGGYLSEASASTVAFTGTSSVSLSYAGVIVALH